MSNFKLRLSIITACIIAIIAANMSVTDLEPGSTAELIKVLSFLTIICVLGMWTVDKLNSKIRQ